MNTLFASFEPSDEVHFLLDALRQAGLAWIADEIEGTLRNGQLVAREPKQLGDSVSGHDVTPYNAQEQLRITIRAIQRYTVEMQKIWHWTHNTLQESLADQNIHVTLSYLGGQNPLPLFTQSMEQSLFRLDTLLRRAWPDGLEAYDLGEGE